jgi:hypothetical protein
MAGGSVHESEATTRAARAETLQPALALGFSLARVQQLLEQRLNAFPEGGLDQ